MIRSSGVTLPRIGGSISNDAGRQFLGAIYEKNDRGFIGMAGKRKHVPLCPDAGGGVIIRLRGGAGEPMDE